MRIVIIGAGQVGSFLARELSEEHDVIVIESNKERSEKIRENFDVLTVHGEGDNLLVLKAAGLADSDILLAVSGDDRTNILASLVANSYGLKNIVCRVRNPNYTEYPELLKTDNISVVSPSEIISEKLSNLISAPFAWRAETFADGKAELFKLRVEEGTEIVNKKLTDLGPASSWIFVGISRGGKINIPSGNTVLKAGDYVYALGDPAVLKRLKQLFNLKIERIHSAIIIGAGRLGRKVASTLHELGISVKIIENDSERAELVAEEMPDITVFKGDATDAETLKEAGVESADYLAALTGDDEENVLSALLAKNLGAKRTTVLYANPDYIDVLEAIGVNRAISIRLAIANEVLSVLHLGGVAHIALVEEGRGEVLEFDIEESSSVVGKHLKDIHLPDESIVGICLRNDEIIIPRGDFIPQPKDRLIVFTLPTAVRKVEKILG